jgi:hypothetical protein
MGQKTDRAVFAFLVALMVVLQGAFQADSPRLIILDGISASLVVVPFWAIIGFGLFGGFVGLLNLFRSENKLKFSRLMFANAGVILGILLKLIFPSLP